VYAVPLFETTDHPQGFRAQTLPRWSDAHHQRELLRLGRPLPLWSL